MARSDSQERRNGAHRFNLCSKFFMWAVGIYVGIVSAIQGWTILQIINHEVRFAKIEHVTEVQEGMLTIITSVQQQVAILNARLPGEFPVPETRRRLEKLEHQIEGIERQILRERGGK